MSRCLALLILSAVAASCGALVAPTERRGDRRVVRSSVRLVVDGTGRLAGEKKRKMKDYPPQPAYPQPYGQMQPVYQGAQPAYGQSAQPAYGQPMQPAYGQPLQPAYGQPTQPTYGQPQAYGQPTYGQPAQSAYVQPLPQQYPQYSPAPQQPPAQPQVEPQAQPQTQPQSAPSGIAPLPSTAQVTTPAASAVGSAPDATSTAEPTNGQGEEEGGIISSIVSILFVLILIGGIGFAAWYVYHNHHHVRSQIEALFPGSVQESSPNTRQPPTAGNNRSPTDSGHIDHGEATATTNSKQEQPRVDTYRRSVLQANRNNQSESDDDNPQPLQQKVVNQPLQRSGARSHMGEKDGGDDVKPSPSVTSRGGRGTQSRYRVGQGG